MELSTTPARPAARVETTTAVTPDMLVEPTVSALPPLGTRIGQYELIEELGHGAMGTVFKARDCKLVRPVAIKFLHRDEETRPEDVARFSLEARATARCRHENIVVIYDVGEHDGRPYMVLEFVDGTPLSKLVHDGRRLPAAQVVDLFLPVLQALEAAHKAGIVHRDLKPGNIMLTVGNVIKLLDFGVAKLGRGEKAFGQGSGVIAAVGADDAELTGAGTVVGTIAYMSPEQCRGAEVDARTDLWAVGIMMFRAVAGRHPIPIHPQARDPWRDVLVAIGQLDEPMPGVRLACPDLPDELADIIDRCLLKAKDQRFGSARELIDALEPLRPGREQQRRLSSGESPYPGLEPFETTDAHRFFGRTREIGGALAHLRDRPLLGVVGASGVGKSSFVRAGLMPALKVSGESWRSIVLRPGRNPMQALAQILIKELAPPADGATSTSITVVPEQSPEPSSLVGRLYAEPGYFGEVLRDRALSRGRHIAVFVDQFEELYTQVRAARERIAFTECLLSICDDVNTPLRLVLAVRSDFLDHAAESPGFLAELKRGLFFLSPPDRDGLRHAIVQPAEMAGYRFDDPELVEAMIKQFERTPGALPLLQFAAAKLWEQRDRERRLLTAESYERLRGIAGALAMHADATVAECTSSEQATMRALLLRLVTPERTRALVPTSELYQLSPDSAEVHRVIDLLVRSRLVIGQTTIGERGGTAAGGSIELVHESLIHGWPLLRRWLEETKDDAVFLESLRNAAKQWQGKSYAPGLLWRGDQMTEAKLWRSRYRGNELPELQRKFLDATFALAGQTARRKRWAIIAALGFLSVLVIAAAVALVMIRDAQQEATTQASTANTERKLANVEREKADVERKKADVEREKAVGANKQLGLQNTKLLAAIEAAESARAKADEARLRAEKAERLERGSKRRATDAAQIARAAEAEAKRAGEALEKLLAQERKRVEELEAQTRGAGIVHSVKKREVGESQ